MASSKPQKKPKANTQEKTGESPVDFVKSLRGEISKITWPTPPQIWGNTVVVIVLVVVFSLGMFAVDNLFRALIWLLTDEIPKHIVS